MTAMLPAAYAAILFLSGTVIGFFVWAWFRGENESVTDDYRRHNERLRDAVAQERLRSEKLEQQLADRTSAAARTENQRKRFEHQFGMMRDLARERKQRLLAATQRGDATLEMLQQEQRRSGQLELNLAETKSELTTATQRVEKLLTERVSVTSTSEYLVVDASSVQNVVDVTNVEDIECSASKSDQLDVVDKVPADAPTLSETRPHVLSFVDNQPEQSPDTNHATVRKVDPKLGVIYTERPVEIDDLKRIAGIAEKLEGQLHAEGVYKFEQIMMWDDVAVVEFSNLLDTFRDRIHRNNWVEQARYFHEMKLETQRMTIPMPQPDSQVA